MVGIGRGPVGQSGLLVRERDERGVCVQSCPPPFSTKPYESFPQEIQFIRDLELQDLINYLTTLPTVLYSRNSLLGAEQRASW
ncbi:hypothetical protein MGG_17199 [Pyricularia oryzae 70-15]|uniref:Uncharacterized protein n=1 Tax=Pyricularia oryzae (strain 70-15 / ATCC MYA-4617 / FGSC 8958) TaxID=242507 RepID=G4N8D8_PYRO7|nr:uncharacterized protein MGG_17199 [Pyricularia oryzae 70-15]EHA50986.1 hypothetical protein MGG_17199 [Pyricularia oryzae 70-15]